MSLTKLVPSKTVTVEDGEGGTETLTVRGLSLVDIRGLMQDEGGAALAQLYRRLVGEGGAAITPEAVGEAIGEVLELLPELAAHAIARAVGEPDNWEAAMALPVGVQMDLLEAIAELTFKSDRASKKVWEVVSRYAKAQPPGRPSISKTGSGV